jgi:hypothetical protein
MDQIMSLELKYLMGRHNIHRMIDERLLSTARMTVAVLGATPVPLHLCQKLKHHTAPWNWNRIYELHQGVKEINFKGWNVYSRLRDLCYWCAGNRVTSESEVCREKKTPRLWSQVVSLIAVGTAARCRLDIRDDTVGRGIGLQAG